MKNDASEDLVPVSTKFSLHILYKLWKLALFLHAVLFSSIASWQTAGNIDNARPIKEIS